ncbi:MAG TPA: ABC transporter permease, partial [Blastocatellia bacterium]|nr:ABC transporter permease [Blastocatellia bacterium]
ADRPGAYPVAVISERLWRSRFRSSPSIVGGTIRLNRQPFTVVGVVPSEFRGTMAGLTLDLWFPIMMQSQVTGDWNWPEEDRKSRPLRLMARLKPEVTVSQANAEIQAIAGRLAAEYPDTNKEMGAKVLSLADSPDGTQGLLKVLLFVLLAVAGIVLLIVCANVGNLLLARSVARQKEFGIRLSLGASRRRLVRQLATETLILACFGAALGLLAANWLGSTINFLLPPSGLPTDLGSSSTFDGLTFGFTFLLCLTSALLCAVAPAVQFLRPDLQHWLKDTTRGSTAGRRSSRLRGILVASEMSLALLALIGAGLFLKSFRNSRAADPGFQPQGVLLAGVQLGQAGYTESQAFAALVRLQERVRALPGISAVSLSENVPLGFDAGSWEDLDVQGYVPHAGESMKIRRSLISPGYFDTMKIPLMEGRDFTLQDNKQAARVAIVNETFARRFLSNGSEDDNQALIGRKFRGWGEEITIVGLAKDSKYHSLGEGPTPFFYVPLAQRFSRNMGFAVLARTPGRTESLSESVRSTVSSLDPNIQVNDVVPLTDFMSASYFVQTLGADLLTVLGVVSLLLAMLGLYGVMGYSIAQRTQEIGIRMAVGAQPADILKLALGEGSFLALIGIAGGIGLAFAMGRIASSMLFRVSSTDPAVYFEATMFLFGFALLATLLPALRAARLNPLKALHWD